jgi:hypothetical protein
MRGGTIGMKHGTPPPDRKINPTPMQGRLLRNIRLPPAFNKDPTSLTITKPGILRNHAVKTIEKERSEAEAAGRRVGIMRKKTEFRGREENPGFI